MASLTLYNGLKSQVEPPADRVTEASGRINDLIDRPVELWVSTAENRAFARLRAEWAGGDGREEDSFFAVCKASGSESVVTRFAAELDALEESSQDSPRRNSWFFRRDEYPAAWLLQSEDGRTLQDLGLTPAQELAIVDLLEDGERLDLGMESEADAAAAVSYLYGAVDGDATMAVSSNGRRPSLQETDLVLVPGSEGNFIGKDERSGELTQARYEHLLDRTEAAYRSTVESKLEAVQSADDLSVWDHHRLLSQLEAAVDTPGTPLDATETDDPAAAELLRFVAALDDGEAASGVDLHILPDDAVRDLLFWTRERLADEVADVESRRLERAIEELTAPVDSVAASHEPPLAATALRQMQRRLSGEPLDADPACPDVETFRARCTRFEESNLLARRERREVRDHVGDAIRAELQSVVDREREAIESQFSSAADTVEYGRETSTRLQRARAALTDFDAATDAVPELPSAFAAAVDALVGSEVLTTEQKNALAADIVDELRDRERGVQDRLVDNTRSRLRSKLRSLRSSAATTDREFEYLCGAKRLLDASSPSPSGFDAGDPLQRTLSRIEDRSVLSGHQIRKLRSEIESEIDERMTAVREDKADDIVARFKQQVERVPPPDVDTETALVQLAGLKRDLSRSRVPGRSVDTDYAWIDRLLDGPRTVRSKSFWGIPYFPDHRRDEVFDTLASVLDDRIDRLRSEKVDALTGRFETALEDLRGSRTVDDAALLTTLTHFHARVSTTTAGPRGPPRDSLPETDPVASMDAVVRLVSREDDPRWLTHEIRSPLRSKLEETLRDAMDDTQTAIADRLEADLKDAIGRAYKTDPTHEYDIVIEALNDLGDIMPEFQRAPGSPAKLHLVRGIDDEHRERFELLDREHRESVATAVAQWVDTERSRLRSRLGDRIDDRIEATLAHASDQDPAERLTTYCALKTMLDGGDPSEIAPDFDLDPEHATLLPEERRASLRETCDDRSSHALDEYENQVTAGIEADIEAFVATDSLDRDEVDEGLRRLEQFVTGDGTRSDGGPTIPELSDVVARIERFYDLNRRGVLPESRGEEIHGEIVSIVEQPRRTGGQGSSVGELLRRTIRRNRRELLILGVLFLIAVGVAAGALFAQQPSGTPSASVESLSVARSGGALLVTGSITGDLSRVAVGVEGSGGTDRQVVAVNDGEFAAELPADGGDSRITVRAPDADTALTAVSMPRAPAPSRPTLSRLTLSSTSADGALAMNGTLANARNGTTVVVAGPDGAVRNISAASGAFSTTVAAGTNGTYSVTAVTNGTESASATVLVPLPRALEASLSLASPGWNARLVSPISIEGTATGRAYSVTVYAADGTPVTSETAPILDRSLSAEVAVDTPGEYLVVVAVAGDDPVSATRRVNVTA